MEQTRIRVGDVLAQRELRTLWPGAVSLPDPAHIVHLQFRRDAACPTCNRHLRTFTARRHEIATAGVREVVVFHSDRETLIESQVGLPFAVVPDPAWALYDEFGVERSVQAIVHPKSYLAMFLGWNPTLGLSAGTGGRHGLPADFLIAPDGRVLAAKYGSHANDQWTVDDLLEIVRSTADT